MNAYNGTVSSKNVENKNVAKIFNEYTSVPNGGNFFILTPSDFEPTDSQLQPRQDWRRGRSESGSGQSHSRVLVRRISQMSKKMQRNPVSCPNSTYPDIICFSFFSRSARRTLHISLTPIGLIFSTYYSISLVSIFFSTIFSTFFGRTRWYSKWRNLHAK